MINQPHFLVFRLQGNIGVVDKDTGEIKPENWRVIPDRPKRESKKRARNNKRCGNYGKYHNNFSHRFTIF